MVKKCTYLSPVSIHDGLLLNKKFATIVDTKKTFRENHPGSGEHGSSKKCLLLYKMQ